jgi:hypothetical protein
MTQEVFKCELSLTPGKVHFDFLFDILVTVMEVNLDKSCGKHFFEHDWVMLTYKEHVLLLKPAVLLLGHLSCCEFLAIYKFTTRIDWLVAMLCVIGDVLDGK